MRTSRKHVFVTVLICLVLHLGATRSPADDLGCGPFGLMLPPGSTRVLSGDTTGSPRLANSYSCSTWSEAGPENVHRFTSTAIKGDLTAVLSDLNGKDLDLFLLSACDSAACVGYGDIAAAITAAAPGEYFVSVDGFGADEFYDYGPYTLTVSSACNAVADLALGVPFPAATLPRVPSNANTYSCSAWNESGPEVVHRLTTTQAGTLRVELTGLEADLDVFLLGSCEASACLAYGDSVALYAGAAPGTYYVVVDGFNGATGSYTVTATLDVCDGANCDDANPCTADSCDPSAGCRHLPLSCDDGNACTTDGCDPAAGCTHAPATCLDGDLCTTDACDVTLGCRFTPKSCNDGDACTTDACDPLSGSCENTAVACDDHDACTTDGCYSPTGQCVHAPVGCDDGNSCTADSCDPATGCAWTPKPCDDGDACTADGCFPPTGACVHAPIAGCEKITFEEGILDPAYVTRQYCGKGVRILEGAEKLHGATVVEPPVAVSSGSHALTTDIGGEFRESLDLGIGFTAGQSEVGVKVGLDRPYPSFAYGVTAAMSAYSGETPGTGFITSADLNLGNAATPVTRTLKVASPQSDIRSVLVRFEGAGVGQYAFEAIDDLTFTQAGPSCEVLDTQAPSVQILEPAAPGQSVYSPTLLLDIAATDTQSGVATLSVAILDASGAVLTSFDVCGAAGAPPCPSAPGEVREKFTTVLPPLPAAQVHPLLIRVLARDRAGNQGQAERGIVFQDLSGMANLWARGMEITQATQPWVATAASSRSSSVPDFVYPPAPASVPLVASRTTVVRVYPGLEGVAQILGARAALRCYTDPGFATPCPGPGAIEPESVHPAGQLATSLKEIVVNAGFSLDTMRRESTSSWNFKLPRVWTSPGLAYLEAEVLPPAGLAECTGCADAANRIRVSQVKFSQVPGFSQNLVHLVAVDSTHALVTTSPSLANVLSNIADLRRIFPIDETTVHTTVNATLPGFTTTTQDDLVQACEKMHGYLMSSFPNKAGKQAVYGVTAKIYPCAGAGGSGYSYGNETVAGVLAHEVGHAVGLLHAGNPPGHGWGCPFPDGRVCAECEGNSCDTDWPWPGGTIGAFGFDVFGMAVVPEGRLECQPAGVCDNGVNEDGDVWSWYGAPLPDHPKLDDDCAGTPDADPPADWARDPHDFMSYGACTTWISPRNWTRMFNAFTGSTLPYAKTQGQAAAPAVATVNGARPAGAPLAGAAPRRYLLVRAVEGADLSWTLSPAYELEFPTGTSDEVGSGEYRIELRGAAGAILSERRFDIPRSHIDASVPEGRISLAAPRSFAELLPLPDGVTAVAVMRDAGTLAQASRTASPPAVTILSPSAEGFAGQPGSPRAAWDASDRDGDALHYLVQYAASHDGLAEPPWETLAIDLSAQELAVSLEGLQGSDAALVRVLATDGINTGAAVSPAFLVGNKAPTAEILSPPGGLALEAGSRAIALGTAHDREDGAIAAEGLTWTSSLDGVIGTGHEADLARLLPGVHQLTLTARDGSGLTGSAAVTVEVSGRRNAQPQADAGPDSAVRTGQTARLDGAGSHDDDGDALSFLWSVVAKPDGSSPQLTEAATDRPGFTGDLPGRYLIQLVVGDGRTGSVPDTVGVDVGPLTFKVCPEGCAYAEIQSALDEAGEGDTVEIAPGTWKVNLSVASSRDVTLRGAGAAPSETVLDGDTNPEVPGGDGNVISMAAEGAERVRIRLENLTITNGSSRTVCGGGLRLAASGSGSIQADIARVVILLNTASGSNGGGICALATGGGTLAMNLENTMTVRNSAGRGGGMYAAADGTGSAVSLRMTNDTVGANAATLGGGAHLAATGGGSLGATVVNGIFSGNDTGAGGEIRLEQATGGEATLRASHSDIRSVTVKSGTYLPGTRVLNVDPVFVNPAKGNFHLNSDSPCIDRGTPDGAPPVDFEGTVRPTGSSVEIGADEFVERAYARLKLLALTGGEVITGGKPYNVTWGAPRAMVRFKVYRSLDDGLSWDFLGSSTRRHFTWTVPAPSKTQRKCRVRIEGYDQQGRLLARVNSSLPFTILRRPAP